MRNYVALVWLLMLMTPVSATSHEVLTGQDAANRFLSAEVGRSMTQAKEEIITEVKAYNDENFQIFDARIIGYMQEIRIKMVLLSIGTMLIAGGIITLVLFRTIKNNSYEQYLEKTMQKYDQQLATEREKSKGMEQMMQKEWQQERNAQTVTDQVGVAAAATMSQMNAWQAHPAHDTAWQPPQEYVQEYRPIPAPHYTAPNTEDPMDVGWNNRGY